MHAVRGISGVEGPAERDHRRIIVDIRNIVLQGVCLDTGVQGGNLVGGVLHGRAPAEAGGGEVELIQEPYNYPQVNIKNATVKNVYGGGLEAEVKGNPQIRIKKGSEVLGNVYGGGNMGEVDGNPKVHIMGSMKTKKKTDSCLK